MAFVQRLENVVSRPNKHIEEEDERIYKQEQVQRLRGLAVLA